MPHASNIPDCADCDCEPGEVIDCPCPDLTELLHLIDPNGIWDLNRMTYADAALTWPWLAGLGDPDVESWFGISTAAGRTLAIQEVFDFDTNPFNCDEQTTGTATVFYRLDCVPGSPPTYLLTAETMGCTGNGPYGNAPNPIATWVVAWSPTDPDVPNYGSSQEPTGVSCDPVKLCWDFEIGSDAPLISGTGVYRYKTPVGQAFGILRNFWRDGDGSDPDFSGDTRTSVPITIYSDAIPPGTPPAQVLVTVRTPACGSPPVPGNPVPGVTVDLYQGAGTTPVETGTTDSAGECLLDLHGFDGYRVDIEDPGGCVASKTFEVGPCSPPDDPVPVDLELCCGVVRITVVNALADPAEPVSNAQVRRLPDGDWIDCDVSGQALIALTTAQMVTLTAVGGTNCTTRLLPVEGRSTDVGWLNYCTTVEVECGSTTSAPTESEVPLEPLDRDDDGIADLASTAGICDDDGCEESGPLHRGLTPTRPNVSVQVQVSDGSLWLDAFDGGFSATRVPILDTALIGGTASGSPWESDTSPAPVPDLECYLSGSTSWAPSPVVVSPDDLTPCADNYTTFELWLRRGKGLWLRFPGAGGLSPLVIPDGSLACAGQVSRLDMVLRVDDLTLCYDDLASAPYDSGWVVVSLGAGDRDLRYRLQVSL